VDTTVWVGHLRGLDTSPHVRRLRAAFGQEPIVVGDLVMLEILQGMSDEGRAGKVERLLRDFIVVRMLDDGLAVRAARHYRTLRARGITIRKTIDMVIGTYCLEHGLPLLHDDRDFDPMERHLGLVVVHPGLPAGG
jgi:predicted nucleic acid-binding protein